MNEFYVYMYLDPDGCPFYIGKGRGKRHVIHIRMRQDSGMFLKNKIRKMGIDNIKTHFLHRGISEVDAFMWERYWIKYIGRRDVGLGSLCNLTDGGEGISGYTFSGESRARMSKSASLEVRGPCSPETRIKISIANSGRKLTREQRMKLSVARMKHNLSLETREKLSKSMMGHPVSTETRKKISESVRRYYSNNKTKGLM